MEFYQIKYFCSIYENKSFSKAASIVHVSQPALSKCIEKMEREFGTPLFQRSTRTIDLTDAGAILYAYGKQMLNLKSSMDGAISELVNPAEVEIHVGMSPFYSKHYLPSILRVVNKQFPNISLVMVECISEEQEGLLKSGELDFSCIPKEPEIPELSYEPICMEEILLAIPPQSPLNQFAIPATPIPFLDSKHINGQKLVTLKPIQKFSKLLAPWMESLNLKCPIAYETLDWDMVDLMVGNGVGIGFVPDILCTEKQDSQSPNYYRTMNKSFLRCYSIAYKSGKTFTGLQRHLISLFKSSIQDFRRKNILL